MERDRRTCSIDQPEHKARQAKATAAIHETRGKGSNSAKEGTANRDVAQDVNHGQR